MILSRTCLVVSLLAVSVCCRPVLRAEPDAGPPTWFKDASAKIEADLGAKYDQAQRARLHRGLVQMGEFWRAGDGDAAEFAAFVRRQFAADPAALDAVFDRFDHLLAQFDGHFSELRYELRKPVDLDTGAVRPFDELFSAYEPGAHLVDDCFRNKLAFVVLLNFPLTTLDRRLAEGETWTRRQWAEVRLAQVFSQRIPGEVNQAIAEAQADAELYIDDYNICMHHLLAADGIRLFPAGLRLVTHWNLRDEIKAQYGNAAGGLARQRLIQQVMERIIDQTIPQAVINNPQVDWNPVTNTVQASPVADLGPAAPAGMHVSNTAEPDTRYARLLAIFHAQQQADPYSPAAPTYLARRFELDRQMSEERVRTMLEQVLGSPQFAEVAGRIERRLGRPLEPFDIWYNGFHPHGAYTEAQLDEIVRRKFPTAAAYRAAMPELLTRLGFSPERAAYLQAHIDVEPSRGPGHAMPPGMAGQQARLRTRVGTDGMNYKGFNIAVHEMGHNIEQTFSMNLVDHHLLAGVPNTAFTEALAMMNQGHDLEALGLARPDARTEAFGTLDTFWAAAEISGVALVDMGVWHWMYEHPAATPAELKAATLQIARDLWNRYYAPAFHRRDVTLLAVYSHMISDMLYLPDYPIGHLIGFQVEEHIRQVGNYGGEYERIAKFGNLAPDLWMKNATGKPVSPDSLLAATQRALAGTKTE
jgi:hypothetical protein